MRLNFLLASYCLLASASASASSDKSHRSFIQVQATKLGAPERWDYVLVDPAGSRVFVAHGDRVDVVDARNGGVVGHVGPLDGAHGIAVAPELHRGFADSGVSGSLTVFDLDSLKSVDKLQTDADADAVIYDRFSRRVFVMNGDSGTISIIDAVTLKPVTKLQIGSKLEFASSDNHGALFVNLAAAGAVARIDTRTAAVTARWAVPNCLSPHGMAYDDATRRIFTSCVDGTIKVLDAGDGHVVTSLPIGTGSDSVAIDPQRRLVFSANGSGTMSVIAIRDAGHFDVLPALRTPLGSRTMAVDPSTGRVFLASATADLTAGAHPPARTSHLSFAPGSLQLLMFDPT